MRRREQIVDEALDSSEQLAALSFIGVGVGGVVHVAIGEVELSYTNGGGREPRNIKPTQLYLIGQSLQVMSFDQDPAPPNEPAFRCLLRRLLQPQRGGREIALCSAFAGADEVGECDFVPVGRVAGITFHKR